MRALEVTRCDADGARCAKLDVRHVGRWVQSRPAEVGGCPAAEVVPVEAGGATVPHAVATLRSGSGILKPDAEPRTQIRRPPSTSNAVPVTIAAASEAR